MLRDIYGILVDQIKEMNLGATLQFKDADAEKHGVKIMSDGNWHAFVHQQEMAEATPEESICTAETDAPGSGQDD